MHRVILVLIGLALALPAEAEQSRGRDALVFAALLSEYALGSNNPGSRALAKMVEGKASPGWPIRLYVTRVTCRASNVDLTQQSCEIARESAPKKITGRLAHEFQTALEAAGAKRESAAGSVFVSAKEVDCQIDPTAIASRAGGGAFCNWRKE